MTAPVDAAYRRHIEMLIVAVSVALLALVLTVRPDGRVAFSLLPQFPLPETCVAKQLFGVPCPGCGLTRSFIHLAHGQFRLSLHDHQLGWIMALAVLFQIPYRLICLQIRGPLLNERAAKIFGYALILALIENWLAAIV